MANYDHDIVDLYKCQMFICDSCSVGVCKNHEVEHTF